MRIIFSPKESILLSKEEKMKILALLQSHIVEDLKLGISVELQGEWNSCEPIYTLTKESLLNNLTELQQDALLLEEQKSLFEQRNNYLEEKVNWFRSKAGRGDFIPPKANLGASFSSDDSSLQSVLVEIINRMDSKTSEKVGLSFSKSKRARKDKALISKSEYFDKEYVAKQLKHLGLKVKDPLEFFVSFGAELELSPSEKFDAKSYLAMNPDVKNSGINPLLHYLKHGKAEGRVLI